MKKRTWIVPLLLVSLPLFVFSQKHQQYVDIYQYIAISEMERTGIPASIKMAQAILESAAGTSTLARKANNHFGIKCHNWNGRKYYHKDDDYVNGKLVKSCFRVYKNPEDSFIGHSEFLLGSSRYASLFDLRPTDYKRWAKGLRQAGYATSKNYHKKLIDLIERYELYRLDQMTSSEHTAKVRDRVTIFKPYTYINDVKVVLAKEGDTPAAIAERTGTRLSSILAYNEQLSSGETLLEKEEKVYIQKKRKNYRGKQKTHRVKEGETMYSIAQLYGLRLDKLYKKNKMGKGAEPLAGERVRIRGRARHAPKVRFPKTETPPPAPVLIEKEEPTEPALELEEHDEEDFEKDTSKQPASNLMELEEPETVSSTNKPASNDKKVYEVRPPSEKTPIKEEPNTKPVNIETRLYHTVAKGETLWRISQRYNKTVEEIKSLNQLTTNVIRTGMRLRVN